jgi:mannosyltransferase OCH1-like enzyme
VIPKRIITTWICDPLTGRDAYREQHRQVFYRCLASWHRLMPDYDIRIVSFANILDYGCDPWVGRRLAEGNFIGASQWARVWWLLKLGGVYVDMDVEAVQRFDELRAHRFFVGHEGGDEIINNAIMGSEPGHPFLQEMLEYLHQFTTPKALRDPQFGNETGPRMITKLAMARRWNRRDEYQMLSEGVAVYPSPVFYPYFWKGKGFTPDCVTSDTIAIHHWASSWCQPLGVS